MDTGVVHVNDIRHDYLNENTGKVVRAIDGVDLVVEAGEFVCILGPSGCGKSTLLFIIAGLIKPSEGTVVVGGNVVAGPGPDRGVVFQEYALMPWKTVLGNVALGLKFAGMRKSERETCARKFIDLVGLAGSEDTYPHELSGGMRQRVAVARTLAADPQVVLMDEPFAAVDAQTRLSLQSRLVDIWQTTGKTVIFVTHSVDEAAFLADRVVVLRKSPSQVERIVTITTARDQRRGANRPVEYHRQVGELYEALGVIDGGSQGEVINSGPG